MATGNTHFVRTAGVGRAVPRDSAPLRSLAARNLKVTNFVTFNRFIFECPEIVGMW
jgi:hypothetical protein